MILPILAFGSPLLRKKALPVDPQDASLKPFIDNLWETMYATHGVGLAASQVNKNWQLFVVDTTQIFSTLEDDEIGLYADEPGMKRTLINATILHYEGAEWSYNEGCLSFPHLRADVYRPETITVSYLNELFEPVTETFIGLTSRVIQHEFDHTQGRLFIDHLKPFKRKLIERKLNDIKMGKVKASYALQYAKM